MGEIELQVVGQVLLPLIQLGLDSLQLLQRHLIGGGRWINLLENLAQYPGGSEESEGAREPGILSRQGGLEAFFGNIFVIGIGWVFSMNVLVLQKFRQPKNSSRKTRARLDIFNVGC